VAKASSQLSKKNHCQLYQINNVMEKLRLTQESNIALPKFRYAADNHFFEEKKINIPRSFF
jgi:hypothetical protein